MKKIMISLAFACINSIILFASSAYSYTNGSCSVRLEDNTLTIENNRIKRVWSWNGGSIITTGLTDKTNQTGWSTSNKQPDLYLPGEETEGKNGQITAQLIPSSLQYNQHVRITLLYQLGQLDIKKIFKLYENVPAIACELYIKGKASQRWMKSVNNPADQKNIESLTIASDAGKGLSLEQLVMAGRHWKLEAVEFFDITDRLNTLVQKVDAISYRDKVYRGNLLFAEDMEEEAGIFFLKEAPTSTVQLDYPNGDFFTTNGSFRMIGLGLDSMDIKTDEWTRAYGYTTGVFSPGEKEKLTALREYQIQIRPFLPDRDEMIMLNTWGDRGQDTRVNESFCLNELQLASRLGVTHFQIDDGWQAGRSGNSAFGGSFSNIWDNKNYWTPDPVRFPNGLAPIVKRGKELGIEVCLWFNPSMQNDYADWEKDADALILLYKTYGIRTFKIDGTNIPNKVSEERLRKLYDKVMTATDWKAVLNLDATAMRRGGYFFFNEFGNIFVENRYTDWQNYYPHWTLRNLWMLSKYMPSHSLQFEFLNKWRNTSHYGNDKFAPIHYSFDYLFAITMVAQPLAWFEAANLPKEAFAIKDIIDKYRTIQHDLHQGYIFPIGEEPSGRSWTGFQSIHKDRGYIVLFREDNNVVTFEMPCYFNEGQEVVFKPVIGKAKEFKSTIGKKGIVPFELEEARSFAVYEYRVMK